MTSLRDAAARALYEKDGYDRNVVPWVDVLPSTRRHWFEMADAVLAVVLDALGEEALRNEMVEAFRGVAPGMIDEWYDRMAVAAYGVLRRHVGEGK